MFEASRAQIYKIKNHKVEKKIMMKNQKCSICKGNKLRTIGYKNKWSALFNNKKILVCNECGFGQIEPKIEPKLILDFYKDVYRSKGSPHYVDFSKNLPNQYFYRSKSISQFLLGIQYLEYKKEYNFLDIGAGLGKSFTTANEIFNGHVNLHAIEEDKRAKQFYQKNFQDVVISSSISEFNDIMDIVLMSHSLEHFDIEDMNELFKKIYTAMVKNGIAIIEIPHADFRDEENEKNRPKDTPHLSFFSLDSFRKLLESLDFEICFIDTAGILIEEMHSPNISQNKRVKSVAKKLMYRLGLLQNFVRIKQNLSLKFRSIIGKEYFYKHVNFQYKGNRSVLRCILRKK